MHIHRDYLPGMTQAQPMTAGELLHASYPDKRTELIRGRLVVREPAGGRHGSVAARVAFHLMAYVEQHDLGRVYAAETGFHIGREPDTVRAPDVAFVTRARLSGPEPAGFPRLAPDLVVEVLSHDDHPGDVLRKVGDWLAAGTRLVWVIDTERGGARVYRADGTVTMVGDDGVLAGEDVVPGFRLPLAAVLTP